MKFFAKYKVLIIDEIGYMLTDTAWIPVNPH